MRMRLAAKLGAFVTLGLLGISAAQAVCPGWSAWLTPKELEITAGVYYVNIDAATSGSDPCGCKTAGGSLWYIIVDTDPVDDSNKMMLADIRLAKALGKRVQFLATSCYNNTPGYGYSYFSFTLMEN
jgi:hypothetical protein